MLTRTERPGNGSAPVAGEVECQAVRVELERILASPVFRNSKRNSSLLRHVVERALENRADQLKERNIGVDVFGRVADYDTNSDHVVRSVAGEVRRRLAQYYVEAGKEGEIRIDLLPGSYVPQFRAGGDVAPVAAAGAGAEASPWRGRAILVVGVVVGAVALAAGVRALNPASAFDRFWNPFFASGNPALLCVGGGGIAPGGQAQTGAVTIGEFERQPSRRMHTSDALALADLSGMLAAHAKPYRMLNRASTTSFRDLQSGPFILIGGMNNEWTLRLTSSLRFGFEPLEGGARVVDRQNPAKNDWTVRFTTPLDQFNRDYAIVSRVRDPRTEQVAVIVAGIGSWGTLAAGEFVTHPEHLKKLEAFAPADWEKKNLQVVISTDVIRGSSGPPNVLAAHFW
ncbi:MAG: hypothetical protein KGN36_19230 [Acidobacteriota bacterium]|nr:hypothetical protein [Acidobacteriota bacterium]